MKDYKCNQLGLNILSLSYSSGITLFRQNFETNSVVPPLLYNVRNMGRNK